MASFTELMSRTDPVFMSWSLMPEPLATEAFAHGSWDACCIDMQHGFIDYAAVLAMTTPVHACGKPVVLRAALNDYATMAKALDLGVDAIVCPMVNSASDARAFVEATKYPPIGQRSYGAYRDGRKHDTGAKGALEAANARKFNFAMVETQSALDSLDAICSTDGIDGVFVGPNDLSTSLTRGAGPVDPVSPQVLAALDLIVAKCREHHIVPGIYAGSAQFAKTYVEQGFHLLALGSDVGFLESASEAILADARA